MAILKENSRRTMRAFKVHVFLKRNMSIRNMRPKLRKKQETFMKHNQV